MTARLTFNRFGGEVGQVVVGKYLSEESRYVYCKASNTTKNGIIIFVCLLAILTTIGFFGSKED